MNTRYTKPGSGEIYKKNYAGVAVKGSDQVCLEH